MNYRSICLVLCFGGALLWKGVPASAQPLFPGQLFFAGSSPNAVACGDINGDGIADAVTANYSGSNVSILLGSGDSTFTSAGTVATGTNPRSVQIADVNADSKLDILTANAGSADSVSVLLGNGNGTFQPKQDYPTGDDPYAVLVADLNGDDKPDIVTANDVAQNVGILRGNGDGTFQAAVYFAAGPNPRTVRAADVNSDDWPDLVVANALTSDFSLLLNDGDFVFHAPVPFDVSGAANLTDLLLKDVTGDGHVDVILCGSHAVVLYAGNGNAGFASAGVLPTGNSPGALVIADFNADGHDDIAAAFGQASPVTGGVTVCLGNGSGDFSSRYDTTVHFRGVSLATADFNADGRSDVILTAANTSGYALPLLGNGDGTFLAPLLLTARTPQTPVSADVNGDGKTDILFLDMTHSAILVCIGQGDATFLPAVHYPVPNSARVLRVADMDNDGVPDLVTANMSSNSLSLLRGNGDGTFAPRTDLALGASPVLLVLDDFNNDGNTDAVVTFTTQGSLAFLPGNGDGAFGAPVPFSVTGGIGDIASGKLDGDNHLDLVLAQSSNLRVALLRGNGNGTFQSPGNATVGEFCTSVALADLNGDHALDILTGCANGRIGVQLNTSGTFGTATLTRYIAIPYNGGYVAAADFDGDGDRDVAAAGIGGNMFLLKNNGSGVFSSPVPFITISRFDSGSLGDFNGDGALDLVVSQGTNTMSVLLNHVEPFGRASLSGTLAFEEIAEGASPQTVVFTFRPTDGSRDYFRIADVNPDGLFSLPDIRREACLVHIKGRKYMAANVNTDLAEGDMTLSAPVPQRAGDANDDNSVDVLDLDLLIQAFDSVEGDLDFIMVTDFNCDGSVDVLDLDLLIRNFDRTGDD